MTLVVEVKEEKLENSAIGSSFRNSYLTVKIPCHISSARAPENLVLYHACDCFINKS